MGGVFAQSRHSANYYIVYPGNTPENHPPTEACMINSKQHGVQSSGPWGAEFRTLGLVATGGGYRRWGRGVRPNSGELSEGIGGTFGRPTLFNRATTKSYCVATTQKAHNFKRDWEEGRIQIGRRKPTVENALSERAPTAYLLFGLSVYNRASRKSCG